MKERKTFEWDRLDDSLINKTYQDGNNLQRLSRSNSRNSLSRTNRKAFYERIKNSSPNKLRINPNRNDGYFDPGLEKIESRKIMNRENIRDSLRKNRRRGRDSREFKSPNRATRVRPDDRFKQFPLSSANVTLEESGDKDITNQRDHFDFENLRSINPGRNTEHGYEGYEKILEESKEKSFIGKITKLEYKKKVGDGFRRYMYDCSKHLDKAFKLRKEKEKKKLEPPIPIYLKQRKLILAFKNYFSFKRVNYSFWT